MRSRFFSEVESYSAPVLPVFRCLSLMIGIIKLSSSVIWLLGVCSASLARDTVRAKFSTLRSADVPTLLAHVWEDDSA